jgi:hypothetical protein
MVTSNSSLLKTALFIDSVVSFISGIALLLFSKAASLNFCDRIVRIGLIAIVYKFKSIWRRAEPVPYGRQCAYGNLVGALGIAVLIFANLVPFTTAGKWAVAIVADAVLVLAILHVGLQSMRVNEKVIAYFSDYHA